MQEGISKLQARLAAKDNETADTIRTATNELQQASLKLFEAAYKKMASERGGSTGTGDSSTGGSTGSSDSGSDKTGEQQQKQ